MQMVPVENNLASWDPVSSFYSFKRLREEDWCSGYYNYNNYYNEENNYDNYYNDYYHHDHKENYNYNNHHYYYNYDN